MFNAGGGDKTLAGGPPQTADVVRGGTWLHVYSKGSDPTGATVAVDVYSHNHPNGISWGDNVFEAADIFVVAASGEPAVPIPGPGGTKIYVADEHAYTGAGIRRGYVEGGGGGRARFNILVGKPRIIDPETRDKTVPELQREARERDTKSAVRWREGMIR